jgi:integrase/recombinase XerD
MLLPQLVEGESSSTSTPVSTELLGFQHFLADMCLGDMCGLAMSTCSYRLRVVRLFLDAHFGVDPINLSLLSPQCVEDWVIGLTQRYRPGSLGVIRASLQSYFRYRALRGNPTEPLSAALPVLARCDEAKLIKTMTAVQLERFLRAFDLTQPTGLGNFAMAHCLSDLGLRGQEVIQLTLDDIDWRAGTLTLRKTKGQRARVLPLPVTTGRAIAKYLRIGRPQTCNRRLFVRHVAPLNEPLGRHGAANAMNRGFTRSGLDSQFSGTHVLRRTLATRLQRCGASLKAIADLLGHRELRNDRPLCPSRLRPADGLRPMTYRTIYGLLASCGLRIGEAIRLTRTDVDLDCGVLAISNTKRHKSRFVPLPSSAVCALESYAHQRDRRVLLPQSNHFFRWTMGNPRPGLASVAPCTD